MRRVEGEDWRERVVGKAAGYERVFIPGRGSGLADEARLDAIPDVAGGEGGHGAAKPHGVIHRYITTRPSLCSAVSFDALRVPR